MNFNLTATLFACSLEEPDDDERAGAFVRSSFNHEFNNFFFLRFEAQNSRDRNRSRSDQVRIALVGVA
jgi:hypothetical protein